MQDTIFVTAGHSGQTRRMVLELGARYVIDPLNPRKRRNRGRVVELLDWDLDGGIVRYLDNGRRGRAILGELAPLPGGEV